MGAQTLTRSRVDQIRDAFLASPQEFRPEWLQDGPKTVLAFEPPLEMGDAFAQRLCDAFGTAGHRVVWGFSSESWDGTLAHEGLLVPLDPGEIRAWHAEFLPFDMVLAATDLSEAVLFGQDEFGLVAGPTSFVEQVLGMPVAHARQVFAAYADEMAGAARHLPGIARRYSG